MLITRSFKNLVTLIVSIKTSFQRGIIATLLLLLFAVRSYSQQTGIQPYKNAPMGYSVAFPGKPVIDSVASVNNAFYKDAAAGITYGVDISNSNTNSKLASWKSVLETALASLQNDGKGTSITDKQDFVYNGLACTEVLIKNKSGYGRIRFLMANGFFYQVSVSSAKDVLGQPAIDKFFDSFSFFVPPKTISTGWFTYTNQQGAFSVSLPNQPQDVSREEEGQIKSAAATFKLNMFVSIDTNTLRTYLVRYSDYPEGTYLKDRQKIFDNLVNEFKDKAKTVSEPVKIWLDGCEGREVKLVLKDKYRGVVKVYIKGNRIYLLLRQVADNDTKFNDEKDPFFKSFKILPTAEPAYYTYSNDSANFKVQMVAIPSLRPNEATGYDNFIAKSVLALATNPNSGGLYDFEYSKLSTYYRVPTVDSLYKLFAKELVSYSDTLLNNRPVLMDGLKGRELEILGKENRLHRRIRVLMNGDYLFLLVCYADSSELFGKTGDVFFNSFKTLHPTVTTINFTASKAEKISNDLSSTDTLISKSAKGALSYYKFTKDELPYVYRALQKNYTDDTASNGTSYKLIRQLKKVHTDSTMSVLSKLYLRLNNNDDLKGEILSTIPQINEKTGYDVYLQLLIASPPLKVKESYSTFRPLEDSIEFAAAHFEQVLPFIKYDNLRIQVLKVARYIAEKKKPDYNKMLTTAYPQLTAYASKDMDNYILLKDSDSNDWRSSMYNYMKLAGMINVTETNDKLTSYYIEKDPKGLYAPDAVVARIYNNLPNDPLAVNKFLDSLGTRYDLMEAYNAQNKLNIVPAKYSDPAEYARLCLYQYLTEDDDDRGAPGKIKLLGSITNSGSIYYVFKFTLVGDDDKTELIGITGPYKPGSVKLDFTRYYAYSTYEAIGSNWRSQAQDLVKPLVDNYKPLPAK